jgi:hypothetical protein
MSEKPRCYEENKWEKSSLKCSGGADPTFTDQEGRHIRPRCDYYSICASRKLAMQNAAQLQALTPKTTIPVMPTNPLQANTQTVYATQQQHYLNPQPQVPPQVQQPVPSYYQYNQQQQPQRFQQPTMAVAPMGTGGAVQVHAPPMAMMPTSFYIPPYLTVPEPLLQDEGLARYIGRNLVRAMGKAIGHTISHVFDTITIKR